MYIFESLYTLHRHKSILELGWIYKHFYFQIFGGLYNGEIVRVLSDGTVFEAHSKPIKDIALVNKVEHEGGKHYQLKFCIVKDWHILQQIVVLFNRELLLYVRL